MVYIAAWLFGSLVTGCSLSEAPHASSPGDTAADTGQGAEDTGPNEGASDTEVTFVLDGEATGTLLGLTWVDLFSEDATLGEVLATTLVEGAEQALALPTPEDAALVEFEDAMGLHWAFYLPSVQLDEDGDGVWDEGEAVVGVGLQWLVFCKDVTAGVTLLSGLEEGWNAIELDLENTEDFTLGDLSAVPLKLNLWPNETLTLAGTYKHDTDIAGLGLALLPYMTVEEGALIGEHLYEAPLSEVWSLTVEGSPPEGHFYQTDSGVKGAPWVMGAELPVVWQDDDGSEAWTPEESLVWPLCVDDSVLLLAYTPLIRDPLLGLTFTLAGLNTGWAGLIDNDDDPQVVSVEALSDLVIDGACAFEPSK